VKTYRASRSTDTPLVFWIRDDSGKRDMGEMDVTVEISRYGRSEDSLLSIAATTPEDGKATATLTAAFADSDLGPGLFRVDVVGDGECLLRGVLEVV
jgi:hypothetical protein